MHTDYVSSDVSGVTSGVNGERLRFSRHASVQAVPKGHGVAQLRDFLYERGTCT